MNYSDKCYILLKPISGENLIDEFKSCLVQLNDILLSRNLNNDAVIKQTIFLRSKNNQEYQQQHHLLMEELYKYYSTPMPPTTFVAQAPEDQLTCAMELIIIAKQTPEVTLERKVLDDLSYSVINYPTTREVYAGGLTGNCESTSILKCAENAFNLMESILKKEKMSFKNVVRQWNYIENILAINFNNKTVQNYQVFNDVRSWYYSKNPFTYGYPAATGIGMNAGGVILEFVAVSPSRTVNIVSIKNPRQINAYSYSGKVLVGDSVNSVSGKTSPKFERAKFVSIRDKAYVYISGTAAIIGQESNPHHNISEQTTITIENIKELISESNLRKHHIDIKGGKFTFSYLRVYVKNIQDLNTVCMICEKYFPDTPVLYLSSDICRKELLVEIEGVAYWEESK